MEGGSAVSSDPDSSTEGACGADDAEGGAADSFLEVARRELEQRPVPDMVHLPGGCFMMGSDDGWFPGDGEGPAREVRASGAFGVEVRCERLRATR